MPSSRQRFDDRSLRCRLVQRRTTRAPSTAAPASWAARWRRLSSKSAKHRPDCSMQRGAKSRRTSTWRYVHSDVRSAGPDSARTKLSRGSRGLQTNGRSSQTVSLILELSTCLIPPGSRLISRWQQARLVLSKRFLRQRQGAAGTLRIPSSSAHADLVRQSLCDARSVAVVQDASPKPKRAARITKSYEESRWEAMQRGEADEH